MGTVFIEYGTVYEDGLVETFIAVPEKPQPFSIHIVSKGYISDGLSVIVFIDGEYQCNRNRTNLRPLRPGAPRSLTEIDFRLRQKETRIGDGTYLGREWRFDSHNIIPDDDLPDQKYITDSDLNNHFEQLGIIEVLVLRCRGRDTQAANRSRSSSASDADSVPLENRFEFESDSEGGNRFDNNTGTTGEDILPNLGALDGTSDRADSFGLDGGPPGPPGSYPRQDSQHLNGQDYSQTQGYETRPRPPPPPHSLPHGGQGHYPVPTRQLPDPTSKHVHFDYGCSLRPGPPPPSQRHGTPRAEGSSADSQNQSQPGGLPQAPPIATVPNNGWTAQDQATQRDSSWGPHHSGYPAPEPKLRYNDHVYQIPQFMHPTPPAYAPQGYPTYHGYSSCTPFGQSPMWPLHPPPFIPGPETPIFIPPYHHNHPYYAQVQNQANTDEPKPSEWLAGEFDKMAKDNSGSRNSSDPAKDENNPDENQGDTNNGDEWGNSGRSGDDGSSGDQSGGWNENNNNNNNTQVNSYNGKGAGENNDTNNAGWSDSNENSSHDQHAGPNNDSAHAKLRTAPNSGALLDPRSRPMFGPHGAYYTYKSSGSIPAEVEEEPRFDVPFFIAAVTGSTRQVQPGKGYLYFHKRGVPHYIDSMEEPYARFIFKYRTKDQLKNDIGQELYAEPSSDQAVQSFLQMDKQDIIEILLRAQAALGGKIPLPPLKLVKEDEDADLSVIKPVGVPAPDRAFLSSSLPESRNAKLSAAGPREEKGSKQQRRPAAHTPTQPPANNNCSNSRWKIAPADEPVQDLGRRGAPTAEANNSSAGSTPIPSFNETNGRTMGESSTKPKSGW